VKGANTVKISKVKHVIITSIMFLLVIAALVWYYQNQLNETSDVASSKRLRAVALTDILPGTEITEKNWSTYIDFKEKKSLGDYKDEIYVRKEEDFTPEELKSTFKDGKYDEKVEKRRALSSIMGVVVDPIYANSTVLTRTIKPTTEVYAKGERLYTLPFDSSTTGGYNIKNNELIDICIKYNDFSLEKPNKYQPDLDPNKKIDVVLAKRRIVDIRDESGNTITKNEAVKPGYVCFRLTYDEINKLEIAKKQGTLFIGKVGYYQATDAFEETFMQGTDFNKFNLKPTEQATESQPTEPAA